VNSDYPGINNELLDKKDKYAYCRSAIAGVSEGEVSLVANLANTSAILKETFGWWWVGFYLVNSKELTLGPFQGPVACTRIGFGKGVCGTAWAEKTAQVVADVHRFPGHIACSAASNSEIVVPILKNGEVVALLDADSEHFAHYDEEDRIELELLCEKISSWF
jgi:L-methionine (R)-S-oxide reductase